MSKKGGDIYQAVNACCFREWRFIPHITQDIRQGEWDDGECVGVMVFDLNAIRNMYATHYPTSASLALSRTASGTPSLANTLHLYAGNQSGIPAVNVNISTDAPRPVKVSPLFTYNITAGQGAKSFNISTALIDSIGNGSSNCLFMDAGRSRDRYMGFTGRGDLTKIVLTINWAARTTAATAPTSVYVNQTIAENDVLLSWLGASAGINNTIIGYEIEYSDSTNNSAWGDWQLLGYINTTSQEGRGNAYVAPPPIRGNFRRFRMRTRGAAGTNFFSGWRISSNSVRKNMWPLMPAAATASPEVYSDEEITLRWSGVTVTTSPIKGYMIASRTSTDNATWSSWEILAHINLAATSGSYNPAVSRTPGTYTQFGVWTIDVLDSYSSERVSNSILNVQKDRPPLAPTVAAPRNGGVTYNNKPMVLLQTQPEPDGQPQILFVRIGNGEWHNSADNPEYFTTNGELGDNVRTIYTADELTPGDYSVAVYASDDGFDSPTVTQMITVLASPFDTITLNQTTVKARHITDLQTAINNIRNYYGMAVFSWEMEITPGITQTAYWPHHIMELRAALQGVINFVDSYDATNSITIYAPWINVGTRRPRADVMNQLQDLVLKL